MHRSIEAEREARWGRMHGLYCHQTEEEAAASWAAAANRRLIAERQIAKLEEDITWVENLTCEEAGIGPECADKLEADKAASLVYSRFELKNLREVYESARATADSYKAAFRFEEESELVKFYGSIFKEKPKPKKRATATRSRKTSRSRTTTPKR